MASPASNNKDNPKMYTKELAAPLMDLPPVEFACAYGSGVFSQPGHAQEHGEPMVDYILGVADPQQWHAENIQKNRDHYSSWMAYLGPKTEFYRRGYIGCRHNICPSTLAYQSEQYYRNCRRDWGWSPLQCIRALEREDDEVWCYSHAQFDSGCAQLGTVVYKRSPSEACMCTLQVHILTDNLDLEAVNTVNLQAAVSAALLLLPAEFSEEDLFIKICSLSYMGDLRMLFAEDKNKVEKIVQGNVERFHSLYKGPLCQAAATGLLMLPSAFGDPRALVIQDSSVSAAQSLVSSLPSAIRSRMGADLGEKMKLNDFGRAVPEVMVKTREAAAKSMQMAIKGLVRSSSLRQAFSGYLASGGANAAYYLAKKLSKAWRSRH